MLCKQVGLGIVLAVFFGVTGAVAQPIGIYAVKDVAKNDSLNVRNGAGASFQDLGDIAFDGHVRVVGFSDDGLWAKIPWETGTAWVSARFLRLVQAGRVNVANSMPNRLECHGTEPFWSAIMNSEKINFNMMEGPELNTSINWAKSALGRPADYIIGFEAGAITGVLRKQFCSDGMSDNDYPWSVVLINRSGDAPQVVEGCCSQ